MEQTYYKIVNHDLKSIWTSISSTGSSPNFLQYQKRFSIQYIEGEWVTPQIIGSKLFVFNNLKTALNFNDFYNGLIYMCEIKNPIRKAPFYCHIKIYPQNALTMWKAYKNKKKYSHHVKGRPPTGTVWCDAVKLMELIE